MANNRDIQYVIRAKDEASRSLESIIAALQQFAGAQGQIGSGAGALNADLKSIAASLAQFDSVSKQVFGNADRVGDSFERQAAKVEGLRAKLKALEAQRIASVRALASVNSAASSTGVTPDLDKVAGISAAQKQIQKEISRVTAELGREEAAWKRITVEAQRAASLANAAQNIQGDVRAAQAAVDAAEARERDVAAAQALKAEINQAAAINERYDAEIAKAVALRERLVAAGKGDLFTQEELVKTQKLLNSERKRELSTANRGDNGPLGKLDLKPWQLTNLTFQVNDVVSGLASSQRISQIFAQQIGQIVQIFPKFQSAILSTFLNPGFLAAAAVFTAIAIAVKQAADNAERLRTLSGILKANADGAQFSAEALNDNVEALKLYHLTAEEALTITRTFIKEGLNPQSFEDFGRAAKDASRVLGIDVKDAAQQMATAFTGGYDAVAKLDDQFNFLTVSEREHIRALFDSGHAAEARTQAFDKMQRKLHDGAEEMRGPWTQTLDHFGEAWERLKKSLGDSSFAQGMLRILDAVARYLDFVADRAERAKRIGDELAGKSATVTLPAATPATPEQEAAAAAAAKANDTTNAESQARQKAQGEVRKEIELQEKLRDATSDADRIAIAGQQAYREEMRKSGDAIIANMRKREAEAALEQQIQRQRRQGLLGFAESFIGKRESSRADKAVLEGLFNQFGIKAPGGVTLDPQKVAWCAAFVNAVLAAKGIQGTGSLAASSFKTFGTPVDVAKAEPGDIVLIKNGRQEHVGIFAGFTTNGDVRLTGGNQGDAVSTATFKRSSVETVRRIPNIGEGNLDADVQAQMALNQLQDSFNQSIIVENAQRQLALKFLREQLGASAQQLFDSQREQAIQTEIDNRKRQAAEQGLKFGEEQQQQIRKSIGDQFDLEHGEQLVNDRLREQRDLREALLSGIEDAIARGDTGTADRLQKELEAATPALDDAIDKAEQWFAAFDSPEAKAALELLRRLRQEIKDTAGEIAKAQIDRQQKVIGGLTDLRDSFSQQVGQSQLLGDGAGAAAAEKMVEGLNFKLVDARNNLIALLQTFAQSDEAAAGIGMTVEGVQALIVGLQQANQETLNFNRQFLMTGRQINETLADMGVSFVDNLLTRFAETKDILGSLGLAFAQFAADFLRQMGEMILKQALFNALSANSASGGGGIGGALSAAIGALFPATAALSTGATTLITAGGTLTAAGGSLTAAGGTLTAGGATLAAASGTLAAANATGIAFATSLMAAAQMLMVANSIGAGFGGFHGGGIVGAPNMRRSVSPLVFAGATRYHLGGIAGLRPNEIPTILERGEEVLTKTDPRHRFNRSASGGGGDNMPPISVVGVFDPEELGRALTNPKNERRVVAVLSRNKVAARQALGLDS